MRPLSHQARQALIQLYQRLEDGFPMFCRGNVHGGHQSVHALKARGLVSNEVRVAPTAKQQQLDISTPAHREWFSLTPKGIDQARRLQTLRRLGR